MRRRRYMYSGAVQVQQPEPRMNFVEAIFSFVFGDGDPNVQWEERRWQTVRFVVDIVTSWASPRTTVSVISTQTRSASTHMVASTRMVPPLPAAVMHCATTVAWRCHEARLALQGAAGRTLPTRTTSQKPADEQWLCIMQLGRIIAAKGGVVTAEEMAPYLDLPEVRKEPRQFSNSGPRTR